MKSSNFSLLVVASATVLALGCSKTPPPAVETPADTTAAADLAPKPAAKKAPSRVEGPGYVLEVLPPSAAPVGAPAIAQIVLRPTDGYHVNKEFPTSLELSASDTVELAKAAQSPADAAKFEEDGAAFEVKFTPKAAGTAEFTAVFKFAVCTETTCDPSRETLAWNVTIK